MTDFTRRTVLAGIAATAGLAPGAARAGTAVDLATSMIVLQRFLAAGIPVHSYTVSSTSMIPSLRKGVVVVGDLRLAGHTPLRGDIVLFDRPDRTVYIKRVIGVPGDRVAFENSAPIVNGIRPTWTAEAPLVMGSGEDRLEIPVMREQFPGAAPYPIALIDESESALSDVHERVLDEDEVYVVGDNRANSIDSRLPDFGPVRLRDLVGRVVYRLRPDADWLVPKSSIPGYPA